MEEFLHIMATWLHVLGVAIFVGPQFFLAFAAIPASRRIPDLRTRAEAMRTLTTRFAYIGGAGLVLIIVAGTYLISTWRDYYSFPEDAEFASVRYGLIFIIKMTTLIGMLALTGLHTFVIGPQQLDLMERQANGENVDDELRSKRIQSMVTSIIALVLTLGIMVMGASMSATSYSFQDV
ncbi:MAG: hypothetical protein U5Q44_11150 [Dehalococcoidia bacterium]|nr:hypothetical protein [Dehalococcoidia bacterium]